MARKYRIVHEQYLVEWLMRNYPIGSWRTNVRLGVPSEELIKATISPEERRMLKIYTAQADAIVLLPDKVVIIEALVRPEWWKILQLEEYAKLFRHTPEFRDHWHKPIEKVLLTTIESPFHRAMCEERGIRVVIYRPPWILEYMATLPGRKTRPPGGLMGVT